MEHEKSKEEYVQRPAVLHFAVEHEKSKEWNATFVASLFKLHLILRERREREREKKNANDSECQNFI